MSPREYRSRIFSPFRNQRNRGAVQPTADSYVSRIKAYSPVSGSKISFAADAESKSSDLLEPRSFGVMIVKRSWIDATFVFID